ncbi:HNH endonuclease signature motif containing protein [Nocardia sp. NPDC050710]|uniref:HNH endonuclease signature motif containing protein n=1 Tax=Nocardia sp. NPDC050710 TaxID=3157220 RepID=UPI0033E6D923
MRAFSLDPDALSDRGRAVIREHARGLSRSVRTPDCEYFAIGVTARNNGRTRERLIRLGREYTCALCGIGPEWQGAPLTLQVDHVNGLRTDHRLENLRFLCPNCHSQTETFCGRINGLIRCFTCGGAVASTRKRCPHCKGPTQERSAPVFRTDREVIAWPADHELVEQVRAASVLAVSRRLGVSDVAIRKRLLRRGLGAAAGLGARPR